MHRFSYNFNLYNKQGLRKYLNDEERLSYFKEVLKEDIHNRLFCLMLFWTGARISEVLSLSFGRIDYSDKVVIFESLKKRRTGIYRQIPLPIKFIEDLLDHSKLLNNQDPDERIWKFSRSTASRLIRGVMNSAKVVGPQASAKGLRHSFAVQCILLKIPLNLVQKWMGHSSISTTAIYLNVVGKEERTFTERLWFEVSQN